MKGPVAHLPAVTENLCRHRRPQVLPKSKRLLRVALADKDQWNSLWQAERPEPGRLLTAEDSAIMSQPH